jgi:hypothetical protein
MRLIIREAVRQAWWPRRPVASMGHWWIIAAMQLLRNARLVARLVLVWFALSLGAAIAAPLVAPKATLLVCSGAAVKVVVQGADGDVTDLGQATLDCPLCAVMHAPPPLAQAAIQPPYALAQALVPAEAARIAARIGAPWQARAPPAAA